MVGWVKDQHGLSEYVIAAERQLLAVPEEFSDVDAVVAQPLACVICAVDRLGEVSGQRAVVLGQGPTGLLIDQVLVDRGALVTGVDPVDRSALAAAMGAAFVHVSSRGWAHQTAGDQRPELVVEAVGHQTATLDHALRGVAPGGQVFVFGVNDDPYYPLNMQHLLRKNLALRAGITVDHARYLARRVRPPAAVPEPGPNPRHPRVRSGPAQRGLRHRGRPAAGSWQGRDHHAGRGLIDARLEPDVVAIRLPPRWFEREPPGEQGLKSWLSTTGFTRGCGRTRDLRASRRRGLDPLNWRSAHSARAVDAAWNHVPQESDHDHHTHRFDPSAGALRRP